MTDNERNIEVAKRLGYSIYHYNKDIEARCYYMLWEPDGTGVGLYPDNQHKTEEAAWQDAPKWDRDLNLALQLMEDVPGFDLTLQDRKYWRFDVATAEDLPSDIMTLDYLPGAIVDWWLAHVDVKALELERKRAAIKDKIASLQDELAELTTEAQQSNDSARSGGA